MCMSEQLTYNKTFKNRKSILRKKKIKKMTTKKITPLRSNLGLLLYSFFGLGSGPRLDRLLPCFSLKEFIFCIIKSALNFAMKLSALVS